MFYIIIKNRTFKKTKKIEHKKGGKIEKKQLNPKGKSNFKSCYWI